MTTKSATTQTSVKNMKAVDLCDKESSRMVSNVPKPSVKESPNSVLVKVLFSALDTALEDVAKRTFTGSILHDLKVSPLIPGYHFSGIVEEVGTEVKQNSFKLGDKVFGHLQCNSTTRQGSCAEYVLVPETDLAKVPSSDNITMEVAAAVTTEAMTALQALRDLGELGNKSKTKAVISDGLSVLVIGGAGGVGSLAIGIAKRLDPNSTITAVCSSHNVEKVLNLYGADRVIDRNKTKFPSSKVEETDKYDLILDSTGLYGFMPVRHLLKSGGRFVSTLPHIPSILFGNWLYPIIFSGKMSRFVHVQCNKEDLELVGKWLLHSDKDNGKTPIHVPIDSIYDVSDFEKARERQKSRTKSGRVVIKVDGGW